MALAVTHVIGVIILLDLVRHYVFGLKKFPRYLLVIGGIAGLAPDLDIPFTWIYNLFFGGESLHGLFTHSLAFSVIFLAIAGILHYKGNMKWAKIFYVIAAGWTMHIALDCLYGGAEYKQYLWPFGTLGFCPEWGISSYAAAIDAIILTLWLVHEEVHKKIRDYI